MGTISFQLASFNICSAHFREGQYTEDNLARIATCIRDSGADVVALQEVDRGAARSARVDMPARLAEMTGLDYHYFIKIRDFQGGEYGTAILSRFRFDDETTVHYPVAIATQGTSCGRITLHIDGISVTLFNTHLSCESEEANTETMECLRAVLETYQASEHTPFLVCGDFNTGPAKVAAHLPDYGRAHEGLITYADRSIDHILFANGVTVSNVHTIDTQADGTTDHYMLVCRVDVSKPIRTMRDKLHTTELYDPSDETILIEQTACLEKLYDFNFTRPTEGEKRQMMLKEMFAEIGEGCYIEPPFHANWGGRHVHFGDHVYANFGLTCVDDTHIYVGSYTMLGPRVILATAGHPILPELREQVYQYNAPIHIGRNCWLGAGVIVLPGVTIGDNTVIGAGSVVTKDIPANVVALGTPCRVLRPIDAHDREVYFQSRRIDWDEINHE